MSKTTGVNKAAPIISVVEDNGGGLTLYVFADVDRTKCVYAHTGYEYDTKPGRLMTDIKTIMDGADPTEWEGCEEDPQDTWDKLGNYEHGWKAIADENGPIDAEDMGAAGRREFAAEESPK